MARPKYNLPSFLQIVAVLGIIAVVTAIIFPVFQKVDQVRRHAHSSCQGNLKILGLACIMYAQDADGVLPTGSTATGNGWSGQLYLYIKSTSAYHCPDDPAQGSFISCAENRNLIGQKYARLPVPAATVTNYEFTTLNCDPSAAESVSATGLSAPQDSRRHDSSQHPFGLNFGFADGHVKFLTPGQISGGPNAVRAKALPQGTVVGTFAVK